MLKVVAHEKNIGGNLVQTIDGRDIHGALDIKEKYTDWIRRQIESLQLIENIDYIILVVKDEKSGRGRPRTEYFFPIDIAKQIALVFRPEKRIYIGRQDD